MKRTLLGLLIVATGIAGTAWGQDQPDQVEGPGRGVARISVMNGDVSVRRADSGEVVAAALNAPLVVEDQLLTGPDARAEVQFDSANMVRLAANSEVRFADLENQRFQLQLARGMVTFSVLRDSNAQVEIGTPIVSVRPINRGSYRVTVREDGTVEVSVRSGEVEIFTPRGSERLGAGRTMLARGTASDPEYQVVQAAAYDDWDRWNQNRDSQLQQSRAYNYVSPDVYGAEDLDSYGTWQNDPTYGNTWYPRVADDWAPYRDGRWAWVDWYGWSWVSYDPWGWAPYHYGRWYYSSNRGWGWWPGDRYGRQYWSPGLVAFVGWDSWGGIRGGLGFGGIGWIPLAPHERYYPWYGNRYYASYRNGGNYRNNSVIVNNFNFNGDYRNARVRNAITGLDGQGFVSGRRGSAVQLNDGQLGRASLVRGALPVTPGRESLRLSDRAVRTNSLPQSQNTGRFFSNQQPARVDRVPFEQQRSGIDRMARQTFGGQQSSPAVNAGGPAGRNQATSGVQRGAAPVNGQAGNGAPAGNRNATGANVRSQGGGTAPAVNSAGTGNSGWRTFSAPRTSGVSATGPASRNQATSGVQRGAAPVNVQAGNGAPAGNRSAAGANVRSQGGGSAPAVNSAGAGNSGWRTFSAPRTSGQSTAATPQTRSSGGSVRAPQSSQPSPQGGAVSNSSRDGWNRFGTGSGNSGNVAPRATSPAYQSPGTSSPQVNRGTGRAPVTVNPPIVRERAPSSGGGSSYSRPAPSSSGSYSRPAPSSSGSYSRPAPSSSGSYSRPAPSSGGGGSYSRPAPSGGGGSYSRPAPSSSGSYSRPAPSSGGGGSYSRPAPSGGGGSYSRPAPSGGGGGGGSYSRPAPSGGGGNSSRSAPSSSGGGGGNSRNSRTR